MTNVRSLVPHARGGGWPWGLGCLALLASVALAADPPQPVPAPSVTVTVAWAAPRLGAGDIVPVDVRAAAAYGEGHLPGALRLELPCTVPDVPCLREALGRQGLSGEEAVLLYGDGASGEALASSFLALDAAGVREVYVLDGGIAAWPGGERKLVRGAVERPARPFTAPAREQALADARWVNDHFGLGGIEVLDLRDEGVWMVPAKEFTAPPRFASGHVPHALPWDFRPWLPKEGWWPDPEPARAALAELGPRPYTPVHLEAEFLLYGEGPRDPAPAVGYLALRRMGIRARVFPGGFAGWSRDPLRPVVHLVGAAEVRALLEPENPGLTADRLPRSAALFDLREEGDFNFDHLPGALSLPAYDDFLKIFLRLQQEHWPSADPAELPLILYCYGRECIRSRDGCTKLARQGFSRLYWLRDGVDAWTKAGLPVFPPRPPKP